MEEKLLTLINRDWTSPALDRVMAVMSSIHFWAIPLALVAITIAIRGGFRARAMLIVLSVTLLVSDALVGDGLKHLVRRPRPNEVVAGVRIVTLDLHNPIPRLIALFTGSHLQGAATPFIHVAFSRPDPDNSRGRSFPSDHTLNNFCAAMVLTCFYRRYGWLFFFPAALVSYSRIYVGAHWPSDVAVSVVMALGLSMLLLAFYEYLWRKFGPRMMARIHERHPTLWEIP
jgi:undecaprenyl-diphosphatase